jgi:hypothetical protein
MDALAALVAILALAVAWASRARALSLERHNASLEQRLRDLTTRLYAIENYLAPPPPPPPPAPVPTSEPVPTPEPAPQPVEPPAAYPSPTPATPDLEALIGGNWLSKLGVFILLIGLALFLGFSLTAMGPAGRIAVGLATGLALLGAGIPAERKPDYKVFGGALIGGGWAALYFTVYAAHALPAARLIESPFLGFSLVLAVAAGMVAHSLRYESQTITGLAFAAAFLAIAISPQNQFARLSSVPLLLTLLAVAWRKNWQPLAGAGASYAYFAYALNLTTGDGDTNITRFGEPILWTYWLLLEAFDLANLRCPRAYFPVFLFNAIGFLLASVTTWPPRDFGPPDLLLLSIAGAYFLSSLLRFERRPDGEYADRSLLGGFRAAITLSAIFAVGAILLRFPELQQIYALALLAQFVAVAGWWFRSPYLRWLGASLFLLPLARITIHALDRHEHFEYLGRQWNDWAPAAALLLVLLYANRLLFQGGRPYTFAGSLVLAILIGAEATTTVRPLVYTLAASLLWLAARRGDASDLRLQAALQAALSLISLFGHKPTSQPLLTLGLPAALYLATALRFAGTEVSRFALHAASSVFCGALITVIVPEPYRALVSALAALALWIHGLRTNSWGAYAASPVLGFAAFANWIDISKGWLRLPALLPFFGMLYAPPKSGARPELALRLLHGVTGIFLLYAHLTDITAKGSLTLAYAAAAAAILVAGFLLRDRFSRLAALVLFLFCLAKLFFYDFRELDTLSRILSFIGLGLLLISASWAYSRFKDQIRRYL